VIQSTDFPPFENLLYEAPGMIMVTTVMVPAYDTVNPAMLSPTLVTAVLHQQIGYRGVTLTDALGGQGLIAYMEQQGYSNPAQGIAEAAVRAFLAGNDLLLCPQSQSDLQAIVAAMTTAVGSGRISHARLLASVHRIIRLKVMQGVMTVP
jgi:beta-glucosidase-like glycosyl hydrolase